MNNELTFNGDSIHLFESHYCIIKNNYIKGNYDFIVGTGKAIWCDGYGNGEGSCSNIIESNVIINHYEGIVAHFSKNLRITKNFLYNTLFGHYPGSGIYLCESDYSVILYNIFAGDHAGCLEENVNVITQDGCKGNFIYGTTIFTEVSELNIVSMWNIITNIVVIMCLSLYLPVFTFILILLMSY
jgi:parallel beta-helix repeat protein